MKQLFIFLTITFIAVTFMHAQDSNKIVTEWKHSVVSGITLSQVAFTDWAQGGENALAWTLLLEGKSEFDKEDLNWSNAYKFAYGQTRLGEQGLRKTDDKIDMQSVITWKM